jgi:hypothetical protein
MSKYAQGVYQVKNPEKYVGRSTPRYRSSWEFTFFTFCDNHPNVLQWASECVRIPYRNPLTGKNTTYVPDIFIVYQDKDGKNHAELIEIKPLNQTHVSEAKSRRDVAAAAVNMAKFAAARQWASANNIQFRIVTKSEIYSGAK